VLVVCFSGVLAGWVCVLAFMLRRNCSHCDCGLSRVFLLQGCANSKQLPRPLTVAHVQVWPSESDAARVYKNHPEQQRPVLWSARCAWLPALAPTCPLAQSMPC